MALQLIQQQYSKALADALTTSAKITNDLDGGPVLFNENTRKVRKRTTYQGKLSRLRCDLSYDHERSQNRRNDLIMIYSRLTAQSTAQVTSGLSTK